MRPFGGKGELCAGSSGCQRVPGFITLAAGREEAGSGRREQTTRIAEKRAAKHTPSCC